MSLILLPKRIFTTIEHLRYRWIGEPRQCRFNAARNRRIGYRDLGAEKARSGSKRSFGMFRIEKMSEEGRFAGSSRTIIAKQVDRNV